MYLPPPLRLGTTQSDHRFSVPGHAAGTGGDVLYIEEASRVDPQLFFEVVLPLLQDYNFFGEMVAMKRGDGKPFFNTVEFGLQCPACKRAGLKGACRHRIADIPPWLSYDAFKRVREIMKTQIELFEQECMGHVDSESGSAFAKRWVDALAAAPLYSNGLFPRHVFVSADPSGGGASHAAMCSAYFDNGRMVVCGLETQKVDDHAQLRDLVLGHVRALRARRELQGAWIVFIPERNLGLEASHLEEHMRALPSIVTMRDKKGAAGVLTTHSTKNAMHLATERLLAQHLISFDQTLVCLSRAGNGDLGYEAAKATLFQQLRAYRFDVRLAKDAFGKDSRVLTGKLGPMQDDLCIAFQMVAFWHSIFFTHPFYESYVNGGLR